MCGCGSASLLYAPAAAVKFGGGPCGAAAAGCGLTAAFPLAFALLGAGLTLGSSVCLGQHARVRAAEKARVLRQYVCLALFAEVLVIRRFLRAVFRTLYRRTAPLSWPARGPACRACRPPPGGLECLPPLLSHRVDDVSAVPVSLHDGEHLIRRVSGVRPFSHYLARDPPLWRPHRHLRLYGRRPRPSCTVTVRRAYRVIPRCMRDAPGLGDRRTSACAASPPYHCVAPCVPIPGRVYKKTHPH